jgi:uncharacterized protein YjbJ (UPF0337 family)
MNKDILKGKWNEVKGKVKAKWGKLTDDDLLVMEGNVDQAAGVLQKRYGIAKDDADRQWQEFRKQYDGDAAANG